MGQNVFFGFSFAVVVAFLVLVCLLIVLAPVLLREWAMRRSPPPVRTPPRT